MEKKANDGLLRILLNSWIPVILIGIGFFLGIIFGYILAMLNGWSLRQRALAQIKYKDDQILNLLQCVANSFFLSRYAKLATRIGWTKQKCKMKGVYKFCKDCMNIFFSLVVTRQNKEQLYYFYLKCLWISQFHIFFQE